MTDETPTDAPTWPPRQDPSEYASGFGIDNPAHEVARAAVLTGGDLIARRAVGIVSCPEPSTVRYWPSDSRVVRRGDPSMAPEAPPEGYDSRLIIFEREALAIYHALADHFGHSTHDAAALRRDFDAQGKRMDKAHDALITIALREPAPTPAPVVNINTPGPVA